MTLGLGDCVNFDITIIVIKTSRFSIMSDLALYNIKSNLNEVLHTFLVYYVQYFSLLCVYALAGDNFEYFFLSHNALFLLCEFI